jgi:predicted  nucleic acid-binding Zn-ribbon protein
MFDKITECETTAKDAEQRLAKSREEVDKVTRRVSDEHATLETELKQYKDRLAAAESKLPASFKADYDRVVRSRGEEALAPLEGESCGGCNVEVTLQMINEVKLNQPVFCKSCGCLLYAAEGS